MEIVHVSIVSGKQKCITGLAFENFARRYRPAKAPLPQNRQQWEML
jgi:hypothetical protein